MAFLLPSPSALIDLARSTAGRVIESAASLATLPLRAMTLLGQAELLVSRITVVLEQVEELVERVRMVAVDAEDTVHEARAIAATAGVAVEEVARIAAAAGRVVQGAAATSDAASAIVVQAGEITGAAEIVIGRADRITDAAEGAVAQVEAATAEATALLDGYAPTLRDAAPLAARFVRELSPEEVTAAIRMIDELPTLRDYLTGAVLPLLGKLDQVGPDLHKLLEVTEDLHLAITGLPGLKMLRRRGEDRVADEPA
jgi:hypothetical protein